MSKPSRLYSWWASWLAALRISRREMRRAKGRSVLVVALIGLPVWGLTFAAVASDSFRLTPEQELDRELGTADASVRWQWDGPIAQSVEGWGWKSVTDTDEDLTRAPVTAAELQAVLPAGSRVTPMARTELELHTATGIGHLTADLADLADPINQSRFVLLEGRPPVGRAEVALTRWAATRLDAQIGDTVTLADDSAQWRVVAIVEHGERFQEALVLHPDAAADLQITPHEWLVDTPEPLTWQGVQQLNQHGIVVRSRAVLLDPPPIDQIDEQLAMLYPSDQEQLLAIGVVVGGLAMLEVVLLAGPAFAVGARRRQRDLALVGASGGTPAQLRRIVLADGVVLGLAGAVVGLILGIAAAFVSLPLLEEYLMQRRVGGWRMWPTALAAIAGAAVLTGVLAALIPATTAARQHLVAALAGRRGITRAKRRWLLLGLVLTVLGAASAAVGAWRVEAVAVLAGLVTTQLGLALCTPALVGLVARAGRLLPLSLRIALRDTARNRAAAAPAIAAVMAAVAGSLTVGVYLASDQQRMAEDYLPVLPDGYAMVDYSEFTWNAAEDLNGADRSSLALGVHPQVEAALRAHLPVEQVVQVWQPACPDTAAPDSWCFVDVPVPKAHHCPWSDVQWEEQRPLTKDEQRQALADERCVRASSNKFYGGNSLGAVIDDGSTLAVLTGASGDDLAAATSILQAGGVVVTDPWLVIDGQATVEITTYAPEGIQDPETTRMTLPAHVLDIDEPMPTILLSPAAVEQAGLVKELSAVVVATTAMPTQPALDTTNAALHGISEHLRVAVERGGPNTDDTEAVLLAIVASLIALGAAAIATGLAAADRRPDLATLAAVGASPRVRRSLSLSQSGVIAGLGGIMGTVAGVGAAFAVLIALNQRYADMWPAPTPYPLSVPWPALGLVLLVVPTVAMLGAGLLTRSRLPVERRPD